MVKSQRLPNLDIFGEVFETEADQGNHIRQMLVCLHREFVFCI